MILRIYFDDTTVDCDIIRESFSYTQNYHNNLGQADNFVKCEVPYSENLSDLLKLNINENILCKFINGDDTYFTGYLKKNISFQKEYRNKAIGLEITSGTYLLDVKFKDSYTASNITLKNAVLYILDYVGIEVYNINNLPSKTIQVFGVTAEENVKDVLKELLFEYGFIFDFNEYNKFVTLPVFNLPESSAEITQTFRDGIQSGNIFGKITQNAKNREFDGVTANFNHLEYAENQLIFNDSDTHAIASQKYLYDNENGCYTEYDCTKGSVQHISSIDSWKVTGSNGSITNTNPTAGGLSGSFENYGPKGLLIVQNIGSTSNTVSEVQIYGTGYFVVNAEQINTVEGSNNKELTLKYINDTDEAESFVENLANYYKYAAFTINLSAKVDYDYGSFVKISAEGMGLIKGRITQKVKSLNSPMIEYTIEAIDMFDTVELESNSNKGSNNNPTIDQVEDIVERVAEPIIEEIVEPIVEEAVETTIVKVYPRYLGAFTTAPELEDCNSGDWYLNTTETEIEGVDGLIHLYEKKYNESTEEYEWSIVPYTKANESKFNSASKDLLSYASDTGAVGMYATAFINHLMVNKLVVQDSIESSNYSEENGTGYKMDSNGDIYANNGYFKGTLVEKIIYTENQDLTNPLTFTLSALEKDNNIRKLLLFAHIDEYRDGSLFSSTDKLVADINLVTNFFKIGRQIFSFSLYITGEFDEDIERNGGTSIAYYKEINGITYLITHDNRDYLYKYTKHNDRYYYEGYLYGFMQNILVGDELNV